MSKIKNGGLDQYGAEPFKQQQFRTAGVEGVNTPTVRRSAERTLVKQNIIFTYSRCVPTGAGDRVCTLSNLKLPRMCQKCPCTFVFVSATIKLSSSSLAYISESNVSYIEHKAVDACW